MKLLFATAAVLAASCSPAHATNKPPAQAPAPVVSQDQGQGQHQGQYQHQGQHQGQGQTAQASASASAVLDASTNAANGSVNNAPRSYSLMAPPANAAPLPGGICAQGESLAWSIGWGFFSYSTSSNRTEMECLERALAAQRAQPLPAAPVVYLSTVTAPPVVIAPAAVAPVVVAPAAVAPVKPRPAVKRVAPKPAAKPCGC
jgi:hypothetical protein